MRPVSTTHTGQVTAPIDRVFDMLTDPRRIPDWLPNCSGVQPQDRAIGRGQTLKLQFSGRAGRSKAVIEIVDFQRPSSFGWVEISRRAGVKTFFKLEFSGGSTVLTMKYVWTPHSLRSWFLGQFYRRRSAHRMFNSLVNNLRKALAK